MLSYSLVNVNALEREGQRQKWKKMPTWLVWLLEHMEAMLRLRSWRHIVGTVVLLGACHNILSRNVCHACQGRVKLLGVGIMVLYRRSCWKSQASLKFSCAMVDIRHVVGDISRHSSALTKKTHVCGQKNVELYVVCTFLRASV